MEHRRRGIVEQQERIAGAERSQTALLRKRDELEAELQRIEPTIGALEAELAKAQATYDETRQAMAAKRIDASAEDGGVEGTLKRGKGPVFRQRMAELEELQRKLNITDEPRYREAQQRRDRASARIVSLKREIATINGEVAKYKGETQTAAAAHQGGGRQRPGGGRQPRSIRRACCRPSSARAPPSASSPTPRSSPPCSRNAARLLNACPPRPAVKDACARHRLRSQAGG